MVLFYNLSIRFYVFMVRMVAFFNPKAKQWVEYENIMADIFDHLIASVPFFELEIFELPSGGDYKFYTEETEEATKATKRIKKKSNDLPF